MSYQQSDINIDDVVDYESEYKAVIQKHHITGHNLTGLCPFHQDTQNSFSVDLQTGKWHCFREDIGGNFISFFAKLHAIDNKEAYKQILAQYGVEQQKSEPDPARDASYTLAKYAADKHLPIDWLSSMCGLTEDKERNGNYKGATYVKFPYYDRGHGSDFFRKRFSHKEFRWSKGSAGKIGFYGEWRIDEMLQASDPKVIIVEGESDTQSLWFMGLPALGVPGASMFKADQAKLLKGMTVILHQEKDQGGETFIHKTLQELKKAGFIGKIKKFSCGDVPGCKDPSDIFMKFGKEDGADKILQLIAQAESINLAEIEDIPVAIKDAPINLRQPNGWSYSDRGIFKTDERTGGARLVSRTPIILTKRLKSIETGEEKIAVAFKRDGEWQSGIYPRTTIFTARGITELSRNGATVTSENAKPVVQFLQALEAENIDLIEKADATSHFGWQPRGRFVPGLMDGLVLDLEGGLESTASAYTQEGDAETWIEIMRKHRDRDKFRFILAAGFAAPLLSIVHQRIFFVYNWGSSKGGKTAALKAALSAWGDPERLMVSFNATQVGLERTAELYKDLPLGIDERQLAGSNQESLVKTVYMISSGKGRTRGSKNGGVQKTGSWLSVALATGEEPLSTSTTQTGVSTRVIEIYGGPFDDEREASKMHQDTMDHFGWAGPEFVKRISKTSQDDIRDYYARMQLFVNTIGGGKSGSHVSGIAMVALADAMIDTWFFGGSDQKEEDGKLKISDASWRRACEMARAIMDEQMSAEANDVNEHAVQYVTDWVVSNRASFGEKTIGPSMGLMSESGNIAYIFPSRLNEILEKAGFSPRKTMKYMAEKGLITTTPDGKRQVVKKFDGRTMRMVEFFIGKISEQGDLLDDEDDQQMSMSFQKVPEGEELPFE